MSDPSGSSALLWLRHMERRHFSLRSPEPCLYWLTIPFLRPQQYGGGGGIPNTERGVWAWGLSALISIPKESNHDRNMPCQWANGDISKSEIDTLSQAQSVCVCLGFLCSVMLIRIFSSHIWNDSIWCSWLNAVNCIIFVVQKFKVYYCTYKSNKNYVFIYQIEAVSSSSCISTIFSTLQPDCKRCPGTHTRIFTTRYSSVNHLSFSFTHLFSSLLSSPLL